MSNTLSVITTLTLSDTLDTGTAFQNCSLALRSRTRHSQLKSPCLSPS